MDKLLNGIFEYLDINPDNGLAHKEGINNMTPFQRLFYNQVYEKIGIDAVYFLRDSNGIAKIPLIYFSVIKNMTQRRWLSYIVFHGILERHHYYL